MLSSTAYSSGRSRLAGSLARPLAGDVTELHTFAEGIAMLGGGLNREQTSRCIASPSCILPNTCRGSSGLSIGPAPPDAPVGEHPAEQHGEHVEPPGVFVQTTR